MNKMRNCGCGMHKVKCGMNNAEQQRLVNTVFSRFDHPAHVIRKSANHSQPTKMAAKWLVRYLEYFITLSMQ